MYNRASADPDGQAVERAQEVGLVGSAAKKWTGYDVPDFSLTKPPDATAKPGGIGLDAHSGTDPFIMKPDGKGWLFVPTGLVDGPLPTHYEPVESPVQTRSTGSRRARSSSTGSATTTRSPRWAIRASPM